MFRKNAVSNQNAKNFLKTTKKELGCSDSDVIDCQYTVQYVQANSVSVLTITEGVTDIALPCVIAANATALQSQNAILASLVAANYYDDISDIKAVVVTDLGANLQVVISGDLVVKSMTTSGGGVTFTARCKRQLLCTYTANAFAGGNGSLLVLNGVARSIGDIVAGTTTAATVKASIEAAFLAAGQTVVATVTTNGTGVTQTYTVVIPTIFTRNTAYLTSPTLVRTYFDRSACVQTFSA